MSTTTPAAPWVRVSRDIGENPKLEPLGPLALAAHVQAVTYAARQGTDGAFPARKVHAWLWPEHQPDQVAADMLAAGLWHAADHGCPRCAQPRPGEYLVHDFLEWQESTEQQAARSEAARRAARTRWNAQRNAGRNADRMPDAMQKRTEQNRSSSTPATPADPADRAASWLANAADAEQQHAAAVVAAMLAREDQRGKRVDSPTAWIRSCWHRDPDDMRDKLQAAAAGRVTAAAATKPARPATAYQCATSEPHAPHPWEDARNRFRCAGVEA